MVQLQVLNKVLDTKDAAFFSYNNVTEDFFSEFPNEYKYITGFIDTYGNVPDKETFLDKFPNFEIINVSETNSYLLDQLYIDRQNRYLVTTVNNIANEYKAGHYEEAMNLYARSVEERPADRNLDTIDLVADANARYNAYIDRCNDYDKFYVKTGFRELDAIIGGWDRNEELATIAARTNQGKSWILIKCLSAALEQGLRVGLYSGEMSENKVGYRFDTLVGHISNSGLIRGKREIQRNYKNYIDTLKERFPNACCKVLTPAMIKGPAGVSALRTFIEKEKLDILFIDQHSLLEDDRHAKNPVEKAANISKDLKNLQVLKKIPIIAVSQQNRTSTENGVGTEHIAQSDRISQDSTIIIFFEQNKERNILTIRLVKSRDSVNMRALNYAFDFDKGVFIFMPEITEDGEENGKIDMTAMSKAAVEALRKEFEDDFGSEIDAF